LCESFVGDSFVEYVSEYGPSYVFDDFLRSGGNGTQSWGVLINPSMYAKALTEFTKTGKLIHFPVKYVYQWLGIMMRNTAILMANTAISGHDRWFPYDETEEFLKEWFGDGRGIEFSRQGTVTITLLPDEVYNLCNSGKLRESVGSDGQKYMPFYNGEEIGHIERSERLKGATDKFMKANPNIMDDIDDYNYDNQTCRRKIIFDNGVFYLTCEVYDFLEYTGIFGWMTMPDGSDAWSDFGLKPLIKIFNQYHSNITPEEALVLVNRALDVYHQRGDMSSIFIEGGSKTLTAISS
jgi:hypothetical protein